MQSIKESVRRIIPSTVYDFLRSGRDTVLRAADWPTAYLHPWRQDSIQRLKSYQNQFLGKRCFVIGNGPSLKNTDVSLLKNEYTFGMNRVYLAFDEWGFQTSFLVSVNDLVIEQCYQDFQRLTIPAFFSWRAKNLLYPTGKPANNTHFLYTTYTGKKFSRLSHARFWEGATVTYVCLQLAFCMGFNEVILIGVDHNFDTKGTANQTIISSGDDPNHFSAEYFGKGFRWQLPDLKTSEIAYQLADETYRTDGRKIIDATVGGKLTVLPKLDYAGLFNK